MLSKRARLNKFVESMAEEALRLKDGDREKAIDYLTEHLETLESIGFNRRYVIARMFRKAIKTLEKESKSHG